MMSLMSIFDPSMSIGFNTGWCAVVLCILSTKFVYWKSLSTFFLSMQSLVESMLNVFVKNKVVFVSIFLFILNMNLAGLLPLVFSPTSHLSFNLSLALVLWLGMMLWYTKSSLNQLLAHLTPVGSPVVLAPMLVLIELVSSLIRPITLSLRLMANVMAGHMILTLISKGVFTMPMFASIPMFVILTGFLLFEFGVALIQSYVFSSLMFLYWEESESSH